MIKMLSTFFLMFFLFPSTVYAVECSTSVSPQNILENTFESLVFTVNNSSSGEIYKWVKISITAEDIDLNNPNADGWSSSGDRSQSIFSNASGGIQPGQSQTFNTNDSGIGNAPASVSVSVEASVNEDGSGAGSCGTSTINIVTELPANPVISNVILSVGNSSATLTWNTDVAATGVVNYGATNGYGSSATTSSGTSHSVTMSSLSSSTTYHYQIQATGTGGTVSAADATFTTAAATTTTTTTTATTTTTTATTVTASPTPTPTPKPLKDTVAPVVSISTDFDKPFKEAPKITGKATDGGAINVGVAKVEYSIDDGKNWLPVDDLLTTNYKLQTSFEFTPAIFEDGDYKVKVRANDSTGNIGYSSVKNMVIDRLPPQVGGVLFSIGPQVLMPTKEGVIYTPQGLDIKITLSAVGGATEIAVSHQSSVRSLVKNLDNGLWSGVLSFDEPGTYQLLAKSIDGAGNKTERALNNIVVLDSGVVKGEDLPAGRQWIKDAKVSLYYFEPSSGQFVLWDGASFGQVNPQKTDEQGKYRLLVPPGRYYLQISAKGYDTLKTNIFTTNQTLPINTNFTLKPFTGFKIGSFIFGWPSQQERVEVKLDLPTSPQVTGINLTGKEMPFFSFKNNGSEISVNNLKGKPTVITFLSIWSPQTFEQLPILNDLSNSNKEVNALAIMIQNTNSKVSIFKKIGGYKMPIVADPDGILIEPLNILNLPTHVFLDRKGIIRKTKVGVLNKEELLDNLVN